MVCARCEGTRVPVQYAGVPAPGLFGFRCGQNGVLSFAFHKSGGDALVAFADDGIANPSLEPFWWIDPLAFPITDAGFVVNGRWAIRNADAVRDA